MMLSDISSLSSDEDVQEPLRRLPRRIRFICNRENPFDLHDNDFKKRFRLNKTTVMNLLHLIGHLNQELTETNLSMHVVKL
jgi:hypothetical protein